VAADETSAPTLADFGPDVTWPSNPDETFRPPEESGGDSLDLGALPSGDVADEVARLPTWSRDELVVAATLGQGGMGLVRTARQISLGRDVAVKQLKEDHRTRSSQRKLMQEAWAAGCLEHPNIVPVYALARDTDGQPMMVQKHLDGVTWARQLRDDREADGRLSDEAMERHLDVLEQVAQAVAFAHHNGVVHRDIKPHNVMLGRFGEVALLDWGLAVALDHGDERLPPIASARRPAGTPSYMAPEQLAEDERHCGTGTDVYLLGAVLYQLLVGHAPHRGPTVGAILDQVRVNRPTLPPHIDDDARRLLRACLLDDPASRPTAARFLGEVRDHRALKGARRLLAQALDERDAAEDALARDDLAEALQRTSAARFGLDAAEQAGAVVDVSTRTDVASPVVRYRLDRGDGRGALLLLDQLDVREGALRDEAQVVATAQGEEEARLERLAGEADEKRGIRTRLFVGWVTLMNWLVFPLCLWGWEQVMAPLTYGFLFPAVVSSGAGSLAFMLWARESLSLSIVNRFTAVTLPAATWVIVVAIGWGWWMEVPPAHALAVAQGAWMGLGLAAVPVLGRWMAVVALSHVAGLGLTAVWPEHVWLWITLCDVLFGFAVFYPQRRDVHLLVREWAEEQRVA